MARAAFTTLVLAFMLSACGGGSDGQAPMPAPPSNIQAVTPAPVGLLTPLPVKIPRTEPAANISLPAGFSAYAIASGFFRPTSIALEHDGTQLLVRPSP